MKLANTIVGVTGASGFIGGALCQHLAAQGATVRALVRKPGSGQYQLDLANRVLDSAVFDTPLGSPMRAMVHCAWDIATPDLKLSRDVNVAGTQWLADQCNQGGVEQFVFISSMAAHDQAHSVYGQTKFEAEQLLQSPITTIIAPGTVIGGGGVFAQARAMVAKLPIIPLFFSVGSRRLQSVYIDDLCDAVIDSIAGKIAGHLVIADESGVSLADFYRGLAALQNRRPKLVPFPGDLALLGVRLLELAGIQSPITSSNLKGIKYLRHFDVLPTCRLLDCRPMGNYWQSLERLAMEEGKKEIALQIKRLGELSK